MHFLDVFVSLRSFFLSLFIASFFLYDFFLSHPLQAQSSPPFTFHVKDPEYKDQVVSTEHGGILTSCDFYLQALKLSYINKTENHQPIHKVIAEDQILIKKGKHFYTGKRLEYDLITKTGILYQGICASDIWFAGGEIITLLPDQNFHISKAFITTSDQEKPNWKIQSKSVILTQENLLSAKNVTFRIFDTPLFWLPWLKSPFKPLKKSLIRYQVDLDQGIIPKISMRYHIYSWKFSDLFFRLNIRPSKGIGAALESSYYSPKKNTKFLTKSYLDHDTFYRDSEPNRASFHYRLQGLFESKSLDKKTITYLSYDKISDKNMQDNFKQDNFEVSSIKETLFKIRTFNDWMISGLNARPRINNFQSIKQELPKIFWASYPFILGKTGIISQNRFNLSFLDYVYAKDLKQTSFDFRSFRFEGRTEWYRSLKYRGISLTPSLGFNGIFYNNSRKNRPVSQLFFFSSADLNFKLHRSYFHFSHFIEPYLDYRGITRPTLSSDTPYIFDINDGFHRLYQFRLGMKHLFYFYSSPCFLQNCLIDLYLYHFLKETPFKKVIPKAYGRFEWNLPTLSFKSKIGWNIEKNLLDFIHMGFAWTLNKNVAFHTQFRHRSRFSWRRNDPENFIMEVTRDISQLLRSSLSDKRNTFFTRLQFKFAPRYIARIESHIGWGRTHEPFYHQIKCDLITLIDTCWKLRLTFKYSPSPRGKKDHAFFNRLRTNSHWNNSQFSWEFSLVKK